jgi:hypothetical protein
MSNQKCLTKQIAQNGGLLIKHFLAHPWRRGVVVIVSVTGPEDRGFESHQGVCKVLRISNMALLFIVIKFSIKNLLKYCVYSSEMIVNKIFLKNL